MSNGPDAGDAREVLAQRHLRFGWGFVLAYLCLGIFLEALHGFKAGFYLDVSNETRRHMWTLAHTHGTLIGVVNLAFCVTLPRLRLEGRRLRVASWSLVCAGVLMPLGFLLGGIVIYGGDPGLPILLVPLGGFALLVGVCLVAFGALSGSERGGQE